MKVYLLRWVFDEGGYDQNEDVIGLYKSKDSACIAGETFLTEQRNYSSYCSYVYQITEMEVND